MGALAGGTQQSMDLERGQTDGLAVAGQTDRPDPGGDVGGDGPGGLGPAQQAADRLETAVDGGRLELALGDHVLAPGDDVVLGQPGQLGQGAVQGGVPGGELEQIVAVAPAGGGREILGGEAVEEGLKPGRKLDHRRGYSHCTPCRPPG
jgi:hypothetical protein